MASLAYYLVLFLYLHACTARVLLLESDNQAHDDHSQPPSKNVKTSYIAKASDRGLNIVELDNHKFSSVQERENIGGKKIKVSYSWKILSQATGILEISKRAERSILESSTSNVEQNISNKDDDKKEEIDVMDYAQPHRKPPIHNKGT